MSVAVLLIMAADCIEKSGVGDRAIDGMSQY